MRQVSAKIIGLTGQTGAGKTTVAKLFEENGFTIIDADQISRQVTAAGSACLDEIAAEFGNDLILANGELDRRALGDIVFRDPKKLHRLEAITYPRITQAMEHQITVTAREGQKWILLDAPTLYESGANQFCDVVVGVTAPETVRKKRIMARDHLSESSAAARIQAQHDEEYYRSKVDYLIDNSLSQDLLTKQVTEIIDQLKLF